MKTDMTKNNTTKAYRNRKKNRRKALLRKRLLLIAVTIFVMGVAGTIVYNVCATENESSSESQTSDVSSDQSEDDGDVIQAVADSSADVSDEDKSTDNSDDSNSDKDDSITRRSVADFSNSTDTIYSGVYLDDVYVGGLTRAEALEQYASYIKGIDNLKLTFTTGVGSFSTTFKDIDLSVSAENAVDEAFGYGRRGNILCRYKEIKGLERDNAILIPEKTFSESKLKEIIETESAGIVTEPKNASITRKDGEFIVTDGVVGTTVKVDETVAEVKNLFEEVWKQKDVRIPAVVEEKQPQYTTEDFEKIDSILGSKQTDYSSGQTARAQNLATGASKISGTVLMPNEQFSVFNTVSPFTEENGYANAGQYVNDELVDGLGGGICQVSTTLYGAVLQAELQVDERYPHSLTVSYVPLGMDAAIAGDYMDFKFTNNTEYPIYIEGYAGGGHISFAIYGHETRPSNRSISFESKTVETYEPGDPEEIEDDTLEEGKTVTETSAHTGYYVEVYKHVYVDGEETECNLIPYGRSKYNPSNAKIRVGTKEKEDDDEDEEDEDEDSGSKKKKKSENTDTEEQTTEAPATEAPAEPANPEGSSNVTGLKVSRPKYYGMTYR